ncbi:DUF3822 family protein [Alkaliflexus imshenetskii]|jgi:hypothetical protein|uniref:DUF3822 family protein n=1 Tax=Alkaliflexus imshenetskii TaxID=286730 RepID=UPI000A05C3D7|nr:DUF3822 family protein [Alkaliflexus imshenetskii]
MMNFSVVDDTFDPNITLSYFLSIQVNLDGFSFCTLDPVKNKYIQMQHFSFVKNLPFEEQVEKCFKEAEKLNLPYKKTLVLLPSKVSTLVPSALFEPAKSREWLSFCNHLPGEAMVMHNKVKMADAFNIFPINQQLHKILCRQFPDPQFFHQNSAIIESNLSTNLTDSESTMLFVNLAEDYFDVLAFSNNNLKLCNTYPIKSENDFIYFLLFTFEQLKLRSANTEIVLSGCHPRFEQMRKQLSRYIRKVKASNMPHHFQYSHCFREVNSSAFYNLLSLPVCV